MNILNASENRTGLEARRIAEKMFSTLTPDKKQREAVGQALRTLETNGEVRRFGFGTYVWQSVQYPELTVKEQWDRWTAPPKTGI